METVCKVFRSGKRLQQLREICIELGKVYKTVLLCVDTRWNSHYQVGLNLLYLKAPLIKYAEKYNAESDFEDNNIEEGDEDCTCGTTRQLW